jgi:hypothetical protein
VHPVAVELDERPLVQEKLDAFAGGHLALLALPLHGLLGGGMGRPLAQLLQPFEFPGGRVLAQPLTLHGPAF